MTGWAHHLIIAPILLPLVAGALLVVYDERRQFLKGLINLFSTLANLAIAIALLQAALRADADPTAALRAIARLDRAVLLLTLVIIYLGLAISRA